MSKPLKRVKVITTTGFFWRTSVSANTDQEMVDRYFLGNMFDISDDPYTEKYEEVVSVEFC
jgi:hypothetical protein